MNYIPTHVQIETVNRFCDARCPMCTIKFVPDFAKDAPDELSNNGRARPAEIMSVETFKTIALKFKPHVDKIRFLSLHGCGEPLLDKTLPEKIKFAKEEVGFNEVGFTSNCTVLTEKMTTRLLEAGLNCIIPSIDGITKEVLEAIRPRTNFERIYKNVQFFIEKRNKLNAKCKVLIRMVRQQLNYHQWDDYNTFWHKLLDTKKGDDVLAIDIHNTGGKVNNYDKMKVNDFNSMEEEHEAHITNEINNGNFEKIVTSKDGDSKVYVKSNEIEDVGGCPDLFSRFSVFASGDVALCSADQAEYFKLGNAIHEDPVKIFNNDVFKKYRDKWQSNDYKNLDYCKDCKIYLSRFHKTYAS
ncbi:radical SAM protein [Candidatus Pelagibacter sp.]|nr:radical SAM protein [Candidatus Pelagibacter sp.]